jgi:hypothetical protein
MAEVILRFHVRRLGEAQVVRELGGLEAAETFGDVSGRAGDGISDLISESMILEYAPARGHPIHEITQFDREHPRVQILEARDTGHGASGAIGVPL